MLGHFFGGRVGRVFTNIFTNFEALLQNFRSSLMTIWTPRQDKKGTTPRQISKILIICKNSHFYKFLQNVYQIFFLVFTKLLPNFHYFFPFLQIFYKNFVKTAFYSNFYKIFTNFFKLLQIFTKCLQIFTK